MILEIGLRLHLIADNGVAEMLVETGYERIFAMVIPQKDIKNRAKMPCAVYSIIGEERSRTYCGTIKLLTATVAIDSYSKDIKEARGLSALVKKAMIDFKGMMGDIEVRDVSLVSSIGLVDMEPGVYRVSDTFNVWYVEE